MLNGYIGTVLLGLLILILSGEPALTKHWCEWRDVVSL